MPLGAKDQRGRALSSGKVGRVAGAFLLLPLLAAFAPPPDLRPGQADRKAILDALRPAVEERVGGDIVFVVETLKLRGAYAFAQVEPRRRTGARIDGRRHFGSDWENMDGLTTTAILRRQGRGWKVVEARIGALDAWYCGFVPSEIFNPC